ncbi:hypothetical protein PIROE2DRAFT_64552 [Piromyces sp. E2]|nr:hypothetical protein PIROE2DRAFT_64552 [Piromyces sp. E2]|eukprot:OUM58245.1 hypothetical protein PIROE2DRAFT_64552 [Piromyces sp. E2]
MVKVQTSVLLKTTLFWLNCNFVFGQGPFMNSGLTTENNINKNKGECKTIMDCSAGALECRKDSMNESVSHCIYPDNLNEVPLIDTPVNNNTTIDLPKVDDTTSNTPTTTNTTKTCTKDEECLSNKCILGQCQIDLNSSVVNGSILNDTIISSNNTLPLNCTTNEECPSHNCVSGQCQISVEQAVLNMCNTNNPGAICSNKLEGEKCEKDSDCMSSFCDKSTNICKKKSDNNNRKLPNAVVVIIITSSLCVGFVLVVLLIRKDRAEKAKKIREEYMENVQEPIKGTCQTLSDCSDDALECKIDSNNGNKSYCIYPEYICSSNEGCYQMNNYTINNDTSIINSLNVTAECTKDEECPSRQCASGQCQVNVDSLIMYCRTVDHLDSIVYQCGKLISDHCESHSDCITSNCDSNTKICIKKDTSLNTTTTPTNNNDSSSKKSTSPIIYIVVTIGVIVGIFLFVVIIYACGHTMEYIEENPEIKEMRDENKKYAGVLALL